MGTLGTGLAAQPRDAVATERGTVTVTLIALMASSVEQTTVRASIPLHIARQIAALRNLLQLQPPLQPQQQHLTVRL